MYILHKNISMKTKIDLENKAWYRLVKVIYILFALFVLWITTAGVIADEWDEDQMHMYSEKKVATIKNKLEENAIYRALLDLSEIEQPISAKDLVSVFSRIDPLFTYAIYDAWYSFSGIEFKDECYIYDNPAMKDYNIDKEFSSFLSWGTAKLCRWWVDDPKREMTILKDPLVRYKQFIPMIQAFYNYRTQDSLNDARYKLSTEDVEYKYLFDLDPDAINWYYIGNQLPFLIFMLAIELLIFLLIIPKTFFYIVLWKQD